MSKSVNTHKMTIRMSPVTEYRLERDYRLDGSRSKNEFIERAIVHALDALEAEQSTTLPIALQASIDGRLGLFEDRMAKLLFKLAVEMLPSGYMEYMAERPRSNGLFGDEDDIDLDAAMEEVNEYPGNIWTHIISLKREAATRLGYDHAPPWRDLLRPHRNEIAQAMHIQPKDFRWYAAFHDEGDHPHIHMMAWSAKPGQAYLSKEGIQKIKSTLTNGIFQQEMFHTYERKSVSRDELVRESRKAMGELTRQMCQGICDSPKIEALMSTLTAQMETAQGKKKYGCLPRKVKTTVDEIVNEMERLPLVDQCYQVWWELQCEIEDYYSERQRERPPLSERKEFRLIKNAVIQEAENIRLGVVTFEDEGIEENREDEQNEQAEERTAQSRNLWSLVAAYREAKTILYDDDTRWEEKEAAIHTLEQLWNEGLTVAAHQLGKCWRDGLGVMPDDERAEEWFRRSAEKGNDFSQYMPSANSSRVRNGSRRRWRDMKKPPSRATSTPTTGWENCISKVKTYIRMCQKR